MQRLGKKNKKARIKHQNLTVDSISNAPAMWFTYAPLPIIYTYADDDDDCTSVIPSLLRSFSVIAHEMYVY